MGSATGAYWIGRWSQYIPSISREGYGPGLADEWLRPEREACDMGRLRAPLRCIQERRKSQVLVARGVFTLLRSHDSSFSGAD